MQTITREDIERSSSANVAELMSKVSANVGGFNDQLSIGNQIQAFPRPGLSSVNLRGIGDGSTLVLINGRRVANYAFDGGAVDVNAIPLAAIDRVEILKDGASAIYGTDAISGVVTSAFGRATFQLRPDVQFFAEASYTYHRFGLTIQPSPAFRGFSTQGLPVLYPAGGPFYPTQFATANGLSGDLSLWYRTVPLGNRLNDVDTHALRAVVGVDGSALGWDYDAAILYSTNRQSDNFASGYVSERKLIDANVMGNRIPCAHDLRPVHAASARYDFAGLSGPGALSGHRPPATALANSRR